MASRTAQTIWSSGWSHEVAGVAGASRSSAQDRVSEVEGRAEAAGLVVVGVAGNVDGVLVEAETACVLLQVARDDAAACGRGFACHGA